MNQREKLLAIVVGSLFGLFLLSWSIPKIANQLTDRKTRINALRVELNNKTAAQKKLKADKAILAKLEEQSLCRDPDLAQSQYKSWLLNAVKETVAFKDVVVSSGAVQKSGDTYVQHTFKVTGKGDLTQLTNFLFSFYQANYLHRIRQLTIAPLPKEKNQLQFGFAIDAVSLQSVASKKELSTLPSAALAHTDVNKYLDTIPQRNIFGPGNEYAPQFSRRDRSETVSVEKTEFPVTMSFKLSASDKDGIASYEIVKHTLPEDEATIEWDPAGNVTIVAKNTGEYTLEVRATDKGAPAKTSDVVAYTVRILEKEPPRTPTPEPPKFDFANTAFFIASVEVGGQPEAWVKRRETGKTLKLHVGDTVEIGSIKGKIVRITLKELELAEGNERLVIQTGKSLSSATFVVQKSGSE